MGVLTITPAGKEPCPASGRPAGTGRTAGIDLIGSAAIVSQGAVQERRPSERSGSGGHGDAATGLSSSHDRSPLGIYALWRGLSNRPARGTFIACSGSGDCGGQVQGEPEVTVEQVPNCRPLTSMATARPDNPTLPTDPTMRFRPIAAFCSKVADGKRVNLMGREDCSAQSWPQDARICGPPRTAPKSWWSVQSRGSFAPWQRLLFSSPLPSEDFLTESSASISSNRGV